MTSTTIIYALIGLLGLVMGSFAGASVWRLRARQLVADKASGEPVDAKELKKLKPLTKASIKTDRSRCLHCGHELAWYDLLPLFSWMSTKGTCRYCDKPIGRFEPVIEIGTAILFVTFYILWTAANGLMNWPILVLWLVSIVLLVILFAYDAKWFLLPDKIMFPLIAISALIAGWQTLHAPNMLDALVSTLAAVAILGGLYLMIWLISKGAWVGFGDVKLGLALGLLLGDWKLAFLALFLANLIGTFIVIPGLVMKKLSRRTQIPFGPLLIGGFFLALFFGNGLIDGYIALSNHFIDSMLML